MMNWIQKVLAVKSVWWGWAFALFATFVYSTNSTIARGAILAGMHPITLLAGRFIFASALFGTALSGMAPAKPSDQADGNKPLDAFGFWAGMGSGLINGLVLVCFFMALRTVSASIQSITTIALIQLFTLAMLAFGGEAITGRKILRIVLGLIGLYFLLGIDREADPFGILLLVVGSIFFAVHIVSVQWYLSEYNVFTVTTLIVCSATVSTLFLWFITDATWFIPTPIGWIAILFQGIVTTFIGRVLTYQAIGIIGSGQYALLAPFETALTILWASIFLSERLTSVQFLGVVFVLLGLLLAIDIVWNSFKLGLNHIKSGADRDVGQE